MKRLIVLALIAGLASVASAQMTPSLVGLMTTEDGTTWENVTSTSTDGAQPPGFVPSLVGALCFNPDIGQWVSVGCFGSGGGGDTIISPNNTLSVGGTATATTLDLNVATKANIWVPMQSFTGGVRIGTGANAYLITGPGSGIFGIVNAPNTGALSLLPTGVQFSMSLGGQSPTFTSTQYVQSISSGATPIGASDNRLETVVANFLSPANTVEQQTLIQVGAASAHILFAVGDNTTTILNTNIALSGAVGLAPGATLTLDSDPSTNLEAATKQYVDNHTLPLTCQPGVGDGLNALAAGTYLTTTCRNETGKTWTLTAIRCVADSGASTCAATNSAGTSLLSSAITGTSTYANGTQSATTTIASGDYLKITFVADGTTKQIGIDVAGTY